MSPPLLLTALLLLAGLAGLSASAADTYPELVLGEFPAAYWPLTETTGTTAHDSTASATHGTYVGGFTLGADGPASLGTDSLAAAFNGSTGSVTTPFTFNPAAVGGVTFVAWTRLAAYNASSTSVLLQQDGPLGRTLLKVEGNIREFSTHLGNQASLSGVFVELNRWYHVALTYDPSTGAGRFYIDGVARNAFTVAAEQETAALLIARHKSLSDLHWNGALAHVAIFPAVLPAERIAALADWTPPPPPPPSEETALTFHVDPAHPAAADTNDGDPSTPLRTVVAAVALAEAGDTVLIHPGTYAETLTLTRSGAPDRPITFRAATPGSVTLAHAQTIVQADPASPAAHIVFEGLRFEGVPGESEQPALRPGHHWTLRDCRIRHAYQGVALETRHTPANDVTLTRVVIEDCFSNALVARGDAAAGLPGPARLRVEDSLLRRGNTSGYHGATTGGGAHFSGTSDVTLSRVISYDHHGPAFRFTWQDTGYLIEDCSVFGNHGREAWIGAGIWIEMSPGPGTVRRNTIFSNTGAALALLESGGISASENLFMDNDSAVTFRDQYEPWIGRASGVTRRLVNLDLRQNQFRAWRHAALTTWTDEDWSPRSGSPWANVLNANTYHPEGSGTFVSYGRNRTSPVTYTSLAALQSNLGWEASGAESPVTLPPGFTTFPTVAGPGPQLGTDAETYALDAALTGVAPGGRIVVPVHGRHEIVATAEGWSVVVYDLSGYKLLPLATTEPAVRDQLDAQLGSTPRWQPLFLAGQLQQDENGDLRLVATTGDGALLAEIMIEAHTLSARAEELGFVPGSVRFRRHGKLNTALTLPLQIGGTAEANHDYAVLPAQLAFAPHEQDRLLSITPLARNDYSPPQKAVTLTPAASPDYVSATTASVDIIELPYKQWRRAFFTPQELDAPAAGLIGYLADPDGDGAPNLHEFAFGGDPRLPATAALPQLIADANGRFFSFVCRTGVSGLTYELQTSNDLQDWTVAAIGPESVIETLDAHHEEVTTDVTSTTDGTRHFFRVNVIPLQGLE